MTDHCDQLHAYVDGELDEAMTTEFEAHLATCEACLAALPRLLALIESLDGAGELARAAPQLTVVDGGAGPRPAGAPAAAAASLASSAGPAAAVATSSAEVPRTPIISDDLAARRTRPAQPGPRRAAWIGGLGAIAAAAAAVVVLWHRPPAPPAPEPLAALDGALGATRPFAARIGYPGAGGYRPQNVERSAGGQPSASDRLLQLELQLEQAKNWHGLAVASLLAGDRERARQAFSRAPATPEVDADRAALAVLDGTPAALERGLDDADRAIAASPSNAAAHWNRALVLAAMNLPLAAAKEFDGIVASHEAGWADEARTRAAVLRVQVTQRKTHWKTARDAGQQLIEDGTPVDQALTDVRGVLTLKFHDALRSAPSRERALALLPLARSLDAAYGATRLTDAVQRVAASDFRVRKPLADRYRELLIKPGSPAEIDGFLARLQHAGNDDIWLGVLVLTGRVGARLDDYQRLATATGDPWFTLIVEQEMAAAEVARGNRAAAERRLRDAIAVAKRVRMPYRAVRLELDLVELHKHAFQLALAAAEATTAYRDAIAAGEWVLEVNALSDLASIDHNRSAYGLARAYLTELGERAEAGLASGRLDALNCQDRLYAYESLAIISLLQLDPDRARSELAQAPTCEMPSITAEQAALLLRKAMVQEELYRYGHRIDDARLARAGLAELRALPATIAPGKDALVAYLEGHLSISDDPAAGERSLREAITLAGHDTDDEFKVKARAYSFALLALEAGRASVFDRAFAVIAESLGVKAPARCAIAIAADSARSVVSYRDATGAIDGQYVDDRRRGPLDVTTLVPSRMIDRMHGCERIDVLARAPVLGSGRLLPPSVAWSYRLSDPLPGHAATTKRLVVANPEAPPDLGLPALAPYPDEPDQSGAVILRGADATPSRALVAMRDASVIEFHTHGILADDLFESSELVLSPEPDRQYALTPRDVAGVHLDASPLVILGACRAATSSRTPEGGMGLAEAFLRSGARAVIASPDAVQDRGALPFFAAIRDRVLAGADPAVALRDERMRHATSHDDAWVSGVVVFE